ncbi:hypothetical protein Y032_0291g1568 [Ancylostoma ceylanicum]|uniref:Uncharacterized protein n=1 Tax=Ancylostoma ceylanicum TaxID=53326 RepID=A0A016S5L2_9BILA|nr:hypothetical protein Y032_0291g1568 [Ancylostoma ceylanicum]
MSLHAFNLKTAKQRLTRQLNELAAFAKESEECSHPWNFPTSLKDLQLFLATKLIIVRALCEKLECKIEGIWQFYNECMCALTSLKEQDENMGSDRESSFEKYWEEKKGDYRSEVASEIGNQLETRVVELECQRASIKQEMINETAQCKIGNSAGTNDFSSMDRRLFGNELKIPEFTGNAAEFDSVWKLIGELIHKHPYSNIEKLPILLSCYKGDAARALNTHMEKLCSN